MIPPDFPVDRSPLFACGSPSWDVIGYIAAGMARPQCDLRLVRPGDEGWRGTFSPAGTVHSMTGLSKRHGKGRRSTVRDEAFEALRRSEVEG